MKKNQIVVLLDADVLVYRASFGVEQNVDWGDGQHSWHAHLSDAIPVIDTMIEEVRDTLKADKMVLALTCSDTVNFRRAVYPEYKMNRANTRKPLLWKDARAYITKTYDARIKPNLEADDVLGIMQTMPMPGTTRIIASIDKDFLSVPGKFYNLKKGQMFEQTEEEADRHFMLQTLTGDATDHYPGLPGVGPKAADKILKFADGLPAMWQAVVQAYKNRGLTTDDALVQARCARILRYCDYDTVEKKPKLWEGPCSESPSSATEGRTNSTSS
jgi:DNA polymerase-1